MINKKYKSNNKSRITKIKLPHGELETPFFMPDATRAVLKNIDFKAQKKLDLRAQVVNTYHLFLQPGTEIIKKAGGANKFMNFKHPLLSDSGGFQVFSLIHRNGDMGKIFDDRVEFKSPLSGAKHVLTPEKSIQIQFDLGVDMMVCLDDCPPNDTDGKAMKASVDRTINWAKRCRIEFDSQIKKRKLNKEKRPILFGVVQGGEIKEERKRCVEALLEIGFDGFGYGARPVDADGNFLEEILTYTASLIPDEFLRFGLGIGQPEDIVCCAKMGWDMFDCVIPTREGRHGRLFSFADEKKQRIMDGPEKFYATENIVNAKYKEDFSPINKNSNLKELRKYSKSYLHHLFKVKDPLATRLASLNNLEFYLDLMRKIRYGIENNKQ